MPNGTFQCIFSKNSKETPNNLIIININVLLLYTYNDNYNNKLQSIKKLPLTYTRDNYYYECNFTKQGSRHSRTKISSIFSNFILCTNTASLTKS